MTVRQLLSSATRAFVMLVLVVGAVFAASPQPHMQLAANVAPTGKFGTVSCGWSATIKDYTYSIAASWSDANATSTSIANAYIGNSASTGSYTSSATADSLDRTTHNSPSYTWKISRTTLPDTKWPIRLWVHDIGGTKTWVQVATANRPACPGAGANLKVNNSSAATVTPNATVTLSWSSSNNTSCTATGSWSGAQALSGSVNANVGGTAGTRTYTLTCANTYSAATASVNVTVTNPPPPPSNDSAGTSDAGIDTGVDNAPAELVSDSEPPAADANAEVKAGTVSALLNIPAGNAATIHVNYNAAGVAPTSTPDVTISGTTASIEIDGLSAKTDYTFQIVRTNSAGTIAMSPAATFTTSGYTVSLHFVDAHSRPVSGIPGFVDKDTSGKTKSDSDGNLSFKNLSDGKHTVTYTYQGHDHSTQLDTADADSPSDASATVDLTNTVNLSKFTQAATSKSDSPVALVLAGIGLLVLIVAALFGVRALSRRRAMKRLATPVFGTADILDKHTVEHFNQQQPPAQPMPATAGKSLREMVVESMKGQGVSLSQQADPLPPPVLPPQPPIAPQAPLPTTPTPTQPPVEPTPSYPSSPSSPNELHIQH